MFTNLTAHLLRASLLLATAIALPNNLVLGSQLDDVYQFLRDNALNRTLSRESEGLFANEGGSYEFRRDMTICNLVRTENRFTYDVIYTIKQRNWDALKEGAEAMGRGKPRIEDRMGASRYEFGLRQSTGEVLGFSQTLTTTRSDWGGSTVTVQMKVDNGKLHVEVTTPRYDDCFAAGGKFYPGAMVDEQTWSVQDGRLVVESRMTVYKVDPTGTKQLLRENEPEFDTESAKLPLK